jgi:hypothetical protein
MGRGGQQLALHPEQHDTAQDEGDRHHHGCKDVRLDPQVFAVIHCHRDDRPKLDEDFKGGRVFRVEF